MRFLKPILLVFTGLFIVVTLLSLLIPSKIITAKAVSVQADSILLFKQISELKNWKNWHPSFSNDSTSLEIIKTKNAGLDKATWLQKGKKYSLVIIKNKYPLVQINIQAPGELDVVNIFTVMPVQEQGNMQVQWQSILQLKWYPWEKFSGIFMEKMAGQGNEEALKSLKRYMEK